MTDESRFDESRFNVRIIDGVPVVEAMGEVDVGNVHEFARALGAAGDQDTGVIVLSLWDARYFDSQALRVMGQAAERAQRNRQKVRLVLPESRSGRELLRISGFAGILPAHETLADAVSAAISDLHLPADDR